MSVLEKTLLTTVGAAKYAYNDAHTLATNFYQIALGDNNGFDFIPSVTDGNCVHEVYRANINSITIDPVDSTIVILQLVLPAGIGGFTVKEARVYDTDGVVMYTANPYFIKSIGSSDINLLFRVKRSNTSLVTLLVDPSITLASQTYVINAIAAHNADTSAHAALVYATKAGVQNVQYSQATIGGTADAITGTISPAPAALVDGMEVTGRAGFANATTTPTFILNGLGTAGTIVKGTGQALSVGDIPAAGYDCQFKYKATGNKWYLLNPFVYGALLNVQVFSTAGTFTYAPTVGTRSVLVKAVGAGGSTSSHAATLAGHNSACSSAGAGAYGEGRYTSGFSGVTVTVGAGGAAPATGAGNAGGSSSFGALLSCPGGLAGPVCTDSVTFPFITILASSSTSAPSGANISGSKGAGGLQQIVLSLTPATTSLNSNYSKFQGSAGDGAPGKIIQPSTGSITAGTAGNDGAVIVYEYM